ncbi:MAG: preprotein translocase subunit SecA [Deltaproteobacteria bacterium]|nr:preprotein translocase subunit SecA [Deltaproteobacteria bacterium]
MGFLQKIFGSKNQRELKRLQPFVDRIAGLEPKMKEKSDAELKAMTAEFKQRLANGAELLNIMPEAYAVVREASVRTTGMRHYDVQMIGGMVLNDGKIAEMRTGEGKTLVATLPTYLNALTGKGVHVVTVNDYLAKRDAEWMGRIHGFLGLSTGVIVHGLEDHERQRNYNCDLTYGQNNEFGFDYLRDNMKTSPDRMVQRGLNYAVVDEVDSILIDEARTPLIISGSAEESGELYVKIDRMIPRLKREVDYTVDEKAHSAMLTDDGVEKMQELLAVENLYDAANILLVHHVNQALRAHTLYKRNVNYLIDNGKVVIISEDTGRAMPGRRWSDGLHQAIEAKEGVTIEEENQTLATVTFQNYFRLYKKLSGMTGTADTEAQELHQIYKLEVVVIPTNKPMVRKDHPDLVYKNEAGKFRAVVADVADCYERGQPVLVGTVSVEKSEVVANLLKAKGLPFNVLNAKQHQREASIVAQAGRKGTITIATNMAGRGTDIVLGGNPDAMAKDALAEEKAKLAESPDAAQQVEGGAEGTEPYRGSTEPAFDEEKRLVELTEQFKKACEAEREEVLAAGGLKIVGTERHESRRIDNQLRGRAGRQGDPGSSRFYLSLQDDLLRIFGLDRMTGLMERLGLEEDVPIESPMVTRSIEGAQKKVEGRNFDQRKNVLEYDDVMNQQRKTIYALRRQVLDGRYHREPTDDEKAKGIVPDPVTTSGDWTPEVLTPEIKPRLVEMIKVVKEKVKERDDLIAAGGPVTDPRPGWRILRFEIWRQFGALLDQLEKKYDAPLDELTEYCVTNVVASQIQQRERLYDLADARMASIIETVLSSEKNDDEWDWDELEDALQEQFNMEFDLTPGTVDEVATQAWPEIEKKLADREKDLGRPWLLYFQRTFWLEEIDQQWIEHLKTMDALREGIGLQGYGQKDPKKEYKRIGFDLFAEMMGRISQNTVTKVFRVHIQREDNVVPAVQEKERDMAERGVEGKSEDEAAGGDDSAQAASAQRRRGGRPIGAAAAAARADGAEPKGETVRREKPKVGRNDPCPCGSGKKYKKCHGKDEEAAATE